ncbi:MAG: hypothetical protein HY912_05530 [Desulfomonile tiedjei]|uniref:Uncharacterized protein n=1 Tax=Desulfomonile tiedjei TaxID=2358 RepID=A0A9D6Z2U8_9BACT|nr:hypothetical protein [Desulfomonile tiedjei]
MTKQKNRVEEFMADIKAGMTDANLQRKYSLSSEKFASYRSMAVGIIARDQVRDSKVKRKVNAHQLLADMRSGMDDDSIMAKYDLTPRGLQSFFRKAIKAGLATALEISRRLSNTEIKTKETFMQMGKSIRELD